MKALVILGLGLAISSCSTTRAPSINMLEKRANYNAQINEEKIFGSKDSLFVPNKTVAKKVDIYIHPHETPQGDYFRGGFLRSIVETSKWEMKKVKNPNGGVRPSRHTNRAFSRK